VFKRTCPRWIPVVLTAFVLAASTPVLRAQAQAPQDEFVPISQLPAQDQLPAAPLLIGAYAFVWVAICGYVISLARRVSSVQRDVARLEDDVTRGRH
jgi:CcmD family protein